MVSSAACRAATTIADASHGAVVAVSTQAADAATALAMHCSVAAATARWHGIAAPRSPQGASAELPSWAATGTGIQASASALITSAVRRSRPVPRIKE
jgi:hypothetical protein